MSLEVEIPGARPAAGRERAGTDGRGRSASLVVALVNNMPDSAVEGTENQFSSLLGAASASVDVRLRFTTLPEVARSPAILARVAERYWPLESIYRDPPDALIVTGTEPRAPFLPDEPYWGRLVELMDFAGSEVRGSVWSCLAAHAAVQRFDGIERQRLQSKRCGVYCHDVALGHPLLRGVTAPLATPHSRWNELPIAALEEAGYHILSRSEDTGADAFVREGRAPMLFFQGHPEYEERTLLKEYQRDVGRFIGGQQERYPNMPVGYFRPDTVRMLERFEAELHAGRFTEPLAAFPFGSVAATLVNSWSAGAARLYANWLGQIGAAVAGARGSRAKMAGGISES